MSNYADINKIRPQKASFRLEQMSDTFYLKPCTAKKLADMNDQVVSLEDLLKKPSVENICKCAMFLMEIESAVKFKKQTVQFVDIESGDIKEREVGGFNLMMEAVSSFEEQFEILKAILSSVGFDHNQSQEIIEEMKGNVNKFIEEASKETKKKMEA